MSTIKLQLDCKEIKQVNPKINQSWIFIERTDAEAETPTLWPPDAQNWLIGKKKKPDDRKYWRQEENNRGWEGWMASLTWWTWVWVSSGSWWWTGKPGVLQCMESQRIWHEWVTELSLTEQVVMREIWRPAKKKKEKEKVFYN